MNCLFIHFNYQLFALFSCVKWTSLFPNISFKKMLHLLNFPISKYFHIPHNILSHLHFHITIKHRKTCLHKSQFFAYTFTFLILISHLQLFLSLAANQTGLIREVYTYKHLSILTTIYIGVSFDIFEPTSDLEFTNYDFNQNSELLLRHAKLKMKVI